MAQGRKKIIFAVVLAAAVIVLLSVADLRRFYEEEKKLSVNILDIDMARLPEHFPAVPMNEVSRVISNFNAKISDGRTQATRVFEARDGFEESYKLYKDFLAGAGNGWTILSEAGSGSAHRAIFAKNSEGILTVNIRGQENSSIVDLSFTTLKRAEL